MKFLIYSTLVYLTLSSAASAELYKWVDQYGNTHYSDKPSASTKSATIIPQENPGSKGFQQDKNIKAIIRPEDKSSRKILLTDIIYSWRKPTELKKPRKLGIYFAGKGCSVRGGIKVPDMVVKHGKFIPKESSVPFDIHRIIKGLGYNPEVTTNEAILERIEKTNGVRLTAEIIDINLHSCAPVIYSRRISSPLELGVHTYKKNRVQLKVKWQLKDTRAQKQIYETETEGKYDGWYEVTRPADAITKAIENATVNLFTDKDYVAKVLQNPLPQKEAAKTDNLLTKFLPFMSSNPGGSVIDKITGNFMLKAKMASVVSEISAIKVTMESYYFSNGEWPIHLDDIGLNQRMFATHELIAALDIDRDGMINVDLKDSFGEQKYIRFIPNTRAYESGNSHTLKWQCSSNIDQAANPVNCD